MAQSKSSKTELACHIVSRSLGIRMGSLRVTLILSTLLPTAAFSGKISLQQLAGQQQFPVHIPTHTATPQTKSPLSPTVSAEDLERCLIGPVSQGLLLELTIVTRGCRALSGLPNPGARMWAHLYRDKLNRGVGMGMLPKRNSMLLPKGRRRDPGKASSSAVHCSRILSPALGSRFPLDNLNYFCDFNHCRDLRRSSLV